MCDNYTSLIDSENTQEYPSAMTVLQEAINTIEPQHARYYLYCKEVD